MKVRDFTVVAEVVLLQDKGLTMKKCVGFAELGLFNLGKRAVK